MQTDVYIKQDDAVYAVFERIRQIGMEENPYVLSIRQAVRDVPAADVELVRHGHNVKWDYPTLFECSLCGWECYDTVPGDTDTYQYCPNCGAKMDEEETDGEL